MTRCIASASGSARRQFQEMSGCQGIMARVAVLAVLMMQALAEQSCQEESQEESSTLMQLNHGDLDPELLQTP